jgi:long-subunit fatty acid transport protein
LIRPSLSILAVGILAGNTFAQLGGEITGESASSAGTAGASQLQGDSLFDGATNPATVLDLFGPRSRHPQARYRFEVLGRALRPNVTQRDSSGALIDQTVEDGFGPWIGMAGLAGERAAWSLMLHPTAAGEYQALRDTQLEIVTVNPDGSGGPASDLVAVETELLQIALDGALAWRVSREWNFGVGLSLRQTDLTTASATEVGLDQLNGAIPDSLSGIFGDISWGELITDLGSARGVDAFQVNFRGDADAAKPQLFLQFGGRWEPDDRTRVGFWYRPPSSATNLEGEVDVDLGADLGAFVENLESTLSVALLDDPTSHYDLKVAGIRLPQQAGVSWMRYLPQGRRVHARAVWTDWSASFSGWSAKLSNPSNPEFTDYLGGDGSIDVDLGLSWKDSLSLSVGGEQDFGQRFTVRSGLGWARNPVGGAVLGGLAPYNQLHAAAGASWWAAPDGHVDWHFAAVVALPESWTSDRNPSFQDLSRDRYRQSVWSLLLAMTVSW